jgi:hypothetical protein
LGEKIKRFYSNWLAPGYGTGLDNARPAALGTMFLILFNWAFFYILFPYETIPNKALFWLGFLAWTLPPSAAAWAVQNISRREAKKLYGRLLTAFGIAMIAVYSISVRNESWTPILFASWPGILNGIGIGIDTNLLWKFFKMGSSSR